MRRISRRDFLRYSAGAAAALPFARALRPDLAAAVETGPAALTTLARTIVKGTQLGAGPLGAYHRLAKGPGEPWVVRRELGPKSNAPGHKMMAFVHYTDTHLLDAQSPARVEFLDRLSEQACAAAPFTAAFRPQETLTAQVLEMMNRQIRRIGFGPATGKPLVLTMCTGDNIDNEQFNELRWFIDLMDGAKTVTPDSGGPAYEGVQSAVWGDAEYWHPDPVSDKYKTNYGFPDYPGLLGGAVKPFRGRGVGMSWLQTFGNHDGLLQGNAPRNLAFAAIATGPLKVTGVPPGANPCDPFVAPILGGPARLVTADADRRVVTRAEYIAEHFTTSGTPAGHGFTQQNRTDGTAYYTRDYGLQLRFISLDTVNPGGYSDGSIGMAQFGWLEQRLIEVSRSYFDAAGDPVTTSNPNRMVVIFSHHGLATLNNPNVAPDPSVPGANDLPRVMADQVEALLHRFPNVIAWVNGHTHVNRIVPRPDPSGRTAGFWDINTAAHVDFPGQSRIIEIVRRKDRRVSIFCTMVDHAGPLVPIGASGVARLASLSRELSANDFQWDGEGASGTPADRNVELCHPGFPWLT